MVSFACTYDVLNGSVAKQNTASVGSTVQPPSAATGMPAPLSSVIVEFTPTGSPGKMPKPLNPWEARLSKSSVCSSSFPAVGTLYSTSPIPKSFFASAAACSQGAKYGWGPPGATAILLSDASATPPSSDNDNAARAALRTGLESKCIDVLRRARRLEVRQSS